MTSRLDTSSIEAPTRSNLVDLYSRTRQQTEILCEPLEIEDYSVQSMTDASPTKWHLAHTSWFFETIILAAKIPGYKPYLPQFNFLFNSYYNAVGERIERGRRGTLSRPTVSEVFEYRRNIDSRLLDLLDNSDDILFEQISPLVELGLHHEQQHQELLLTDIKHAFGCNPLRPAYNADLVIESPEPRRLSWTPMSSGVYEIGNDGTTFGFDNEGPRHQTFLPDFALADRLVTVEEYFEFMADGGYDRHELWLSDGWHARQEEDWRAPLYWEQRDGEWWHLTLAGMRPLDPSEPVCHVSYYEADAYARWTGFRLPTEAEWEASTQCPSAQGSFLEQGQYHPMSAQGDALSQLFGDVWEWTSSAYAAYPGFRAAPGVIREYNGKFMCNQMVLRGGSCVTPGAHIRATYRNFFYPNSRWQFSGFRLARDC